MRSAIALTLLLASGGAQASPVTVDREAMQQQLSSLGQQVADLQWALTTMGALRNPPIAEALARIQRQVAELQRRMALAPPSPPTAPTPPLAAPPIDDASLANLMTAIGNEGFSAGKLGVVEQAARSYAFTVAQLLQLLNQFTFSKDKVRTVEAVAPRLVDRQNAFQLYDAFTFSSDKERVQKILSR